MVFCGQCPYVSFTTKGASPGLNRQIRIILSRGDKNVRHISVQYGPYCMAHTVYGIHPSMMSQSEVIKRVRISVKKPFQWILLDDDMKNCMLANNPRYNWINLMKTIYYDLDLQSSQGREKIITTTDFFWPEILFERLLSYKIHFTHNI